MFSKRFKKVKGRLKSDRAAGFLIVVIIMLPVFLMALGFSFDVAKNAYVKSQYNEMLQNVSSEAVRYVGTDGSLASGSYGTSLVASKVVEKYIYFMENKNVAEQQFISAYNRVKTDPGASCSTSDEIPGWAGEHKLPVIKITFSGERHQSNYGDQTTESIFWSPDGFSNPDGDIPNQFYHSMNVEVFDQSPNFILGMFGMNCQKLDLKLSSITFGSQTDVNGYSYNR